MPGLFRHLARVRRIVSGSMTRLRASRWSHAATPLPLRSLSTHAWTWALGPTVKRCLHWPAVANNGSNGRVPTDVLCRSPRNHSTGISGAAVLSLLEPERAAGAAPASLPGICDSRRAQRRSDRLPDGRIPAYTSIYQPIPAYTSIHDDDDDQRGTGSTPRSG